MRNVNVFLIKKYTYAQSYKIEINKNFLSLFFCVFKSLILKGNFFAFRMSKLLKGA